MGQKVTAPLFAALFPLKEIASRFQSGRMQSSAMVTRKIVLQTTNTFLLVYVCRMFMSSLLENSISRYLIGDAVRSNSKQQTDSRFEQADGGTKAVLSIDQ